VLAFGEITRWVMRIGCVDRSDAETLTLLADVIQSNSPSRVPL